MKTQVLKQAGLVMALFGAAYAAEAQTTDSARPSKEEILAKYDADGDGVLSDTERETMRSEMSALRGQRGQGGQSGQRQRPNREEIIAKYDADGDGVLSDAEKETMRSEMGQRGERGERGQRGQRGQNSTAAMVAKYDADGNGELSAAELQQLLSEQENQSDMNQERGRRGGQGQGEENQAQGRKQRMSREEMIAKYDADGDGKLSDTERAAMRADMKKGDSADTTTE